VGERVAKLKERLNTYTKEAAEIEIHLTQAKETLLAAENLVGKLNDEYERWKTQVNEHHTFLSQVLIGKMTMCTYAYTSIRKVHLYLKVLGILVLIHVTLCVSSVIL
jgi:septal ring factor EnvC (AmiA/AmiB activator)